MHLFLTEGMGWIEVITGTMFSGKSEELIRRLRRAKYANQKVVAFKHSIDKRYDEEKLASHNKNFIEAVAVKNVAEMKKLLLEKYTNMEVIGIDEVQFFGEEIVEFLEEMANKGKRVIVAGLDQDFRGEPFYPMPEILARAEYVDKLNAICMVCGNPASRPQRLVDGEPAYYDDPIIMVGAAESYEARCRKCHIVRKKECTDGKLYFIVGTNTEIGKTVSTVELIKDELALGKKVAVIKPVETGKELFGKTLNGSDTKCYADLLGKEVSEINEYFFTKPLSPHLAAKHDNKEIEIDKIRQKIDDALKENDTVFVEGAGGLLVPYKDEYTYLDLLAHFRKRSEVIIISANTLGTINHTLLTVDVLKRNDIKIKGIVYNNKDNIKDESFLLENIKTIEKFSKLPTLKRIKFFENN